MNGSQGKLNQRLARDVKDMIGKLNKLSKRESYNLHRWVNKKLGKANHCEFDETHKAILFHWANRSNEYKKELTDWISLCPKCHQQYDMNYRMKQAKSRMKQAKSILKIDVDYSAVAASLDMPLDDFMQGLERGIKMFDTFKN